ncbi:MAG: histidinol dehydrogenase [Dictyoglomus sp.]|nr:histidinol dehydrogenase [Dictyoglomus sp.]MCX7941929.1 histidinol dehydrogenase [Dictyoglomaceae bacterium]MDW8188620.1 histidinol dehydrogenase [Dictyoglomus sp.]
MIRVIDYEEFKKINIEKARMEWEEEIEKEVREILKEVKEKKDKALIELTKRFDGIDLSEKGFKLDLEKIKIEEIKVKEEFKKSINEMIKRVEDYYRRESLNSWFYMNPKGSILGQILRPIEKVGIYIPGGKADYPSSIVMSVIPARIAGVEKIYITTPPRERFNESFLYTLKILDIDEIFTIGGAHAIFAFAYGTESIPKVDLIIGPGNIYVAMAKKLVFGEVGIDGINGPSEIALWVKDENFNIKKIICDFLAQLEHSQNDRGWLILEKEDKIPFILDEIKKELRDSPRKEYIENSLKNSFIILAKEEEALDVINDIAPEHLEIISKDAEKYLPFIKNAGAIFINHSSIFGDFIAGPSHILPTGRRAVFSSGLCVNTFLKRISFVKLSEEDIKDIFDYGSVIAKEEGFFMHEKSLKNYGD